MVISLESAPLPPLRAAQYVRVSTDHQQYSIVNQSAAIALYAVANEIAIVRSYVDSGKSGVCIKGRYGLQELIETVQSGVADFQCILVYDVSRWGRFQDLDEAAHYEYLCKHAGIAVRYCVEQFENDNKMLSNLLKTLRRMMAGEYSRELSVKVFAAQFRLARMGFTQGGSPGYGFRRLLVDLNSHPKQILRSGERKAVHSDRVVLVAGPSEEVQTIRKIFDLCTIHRRTTRQIASELNQGHLKTHLGKQWDPGDVRRLIMNPKYMGSYVWGRNSKKLNAPLTSNDPEQWAISRGAIAPAISGYQFAVAQSRLKLQRQRFTNQQLLDRLRRLWETKGTLSVRIVNQSKKGPSTTMFAGRFGGLANALSLIGFKQTRDYDRVQEQKVLRRKLERALQKDVSEQIRARGGRISEDPRSRVLTLNGHFGVAVKVMHYRHWNAKWRRVGWHFMINFRKGVHVLIIGCLDPTNQHIQSQYIIPKLTQLEGMYWVNDGVGRVFLEACRSDTLQPFLESVTCCPLPKSESE